MFGTPFYNRALRKYVVAFGNLFNNITMIRYKTDGVTEVDRMKVPLSYGPKEKYISKLVQDLDLNRNVQVQLPRMAFEIIGIAYDPMRKQETTMKRKRSISGSSNRISSTYVETPYDINFELSIMVRNIEDGNQIVEQILPYFAPQYSMSINTNSAFPDEYRTVPVTLNSVNQSIDYEGNYESTRSIVWTLAFTMKAWISGPTATQNVITSVITNIYDESAKISIMNDNQLSINMANVSGNVFRYGELVYQGTNPADATAVGTVSDWLSSASRLTIKVLGGNFSLNVRTWALDTNASAIASTFFIPDKKVINIVVTPNPATANGSGDYGYTTVIREYPTAN